MSDSIAINAKNRDEYSVKNWHLYLFVTLTFLILTLINDRFIMTREVYGLLLEDKIESNRIDDYYKLLKIFSIYTYLALPFIIWLKITFIALILQTPLLLKSIEASFNECFRIAALANIPFLLLGVIKLTILFFSPGNAISYDLINLIPGAVSNLIDKSSYSPAAYNFLSNINVYEALWVLIVFSCISNLKKISKTDSFILAFSIWLILTAFQFGLVLYFNKV